MRRAILSGFPSLALTLVAGCGDGNKTNPTQADSRTDDAAALPRQVCAADNGGIVLPTGFCASVFADALGRARHMAVTPSGDVFVAIDPPPMPPTPPGNTAPGHVVALRDADHDGIAEVHQTIADAGGNGIAWADGFLYVASDDRIVRYTLPDGQLMPTSGPDVIVSGLPSTGDHHRKTVVLVGGSLYVNIGSATNACQVANRMPLSPGIEPCPELATRAGIWKFTASVLGQTLADGTRFATGMRNANALGADGSGTLWVALNGRDQLADNWPALFTPAQDMQLPSEEIYPVHEGDDHGWPYCYHDPVRHQMMLAPEYGGDGATVGRCAQAATPTLTMPAHWAPLSIAFNSRDRFPARFQGAAFIANHGSRFDMNAVGDPGYNVVMIPFANGAPDGNWENFATGFTAGGTPLPDAARYRPVGVTAMPDGTILISDDKVGRIWKVTYQP